MSVICSLKTTTLRTAVVRMRRSKSATGKRTKEDLREFIRIHSKVHAIPDALNTMTTAQLISHRSSLVHEFHPIPSTMNRDALLTYIYWSANRLKWSWGSTIHGMPTKPRVTRKCLGSRQPGSNANPPRSILSKANRGLRRTPSAYNLHIQAEMQQNKARIPDARERFADAVQSWNRQKSGLSS